MSCLALGSIVEVWSDAILFMCTFKTVLPYLLACLPDSLLNAQGKHTTFIAHFEDRQLTLFHTELLRSVHAQTQRKRHVQQLQWQLTAI